MNEELWTTVDRYVADALIPSDPVLEAVLKTSAAAGLPSINVTPNVGRLLQLLVRIAGAKKILEIGTLGGYSTIWLARALPPGGRIITLESEPRHADVARANFARAGVEDVIDLRLGRALDTLPKIASEASGPFDLVFIDADKENNPEYFGWAIKLLRPGGLIIVDNVVRKGKVIDEASTDPMIRGTRRLYEMLSKESRVTATAIQTVGSKGYDGFLIARVN
jgi:predicted O-methyltransferase YrrM